MAGGRPLPIRGKPKELPTTTWEPGYGPESAPANGWRICEYI